MVYQLVHSKELQALPEAALVWKKLLPLPLMGTFRDAATEKKMVVL